MKTSDWIMIHSQLDEFVRIRLDGEEVDTPLAELPKPVAAAIRTARDALLKHHKAKWLAPGKTIKLNK